MSVRVRNVVGRITKDGVEAHLVGSNLVGRGKTLVQAYADLDRQESQTPSPTKSPAAQPHAAAKAGAACPSRAAPAAIPDDILEAATQLAATYAFDVHGLLVGAIAAALLTERQKATEAERERCAGILRSYPNSIIAESLGAAIRSNQEGKG